MHLISEQGGRKEVAISFSFERGRTKGDWKKFYRIHFLVFLGKNGSEGQLQDQGAANSQFIFISNPI